MKRMTLFGAVAIAMIVGNDASAQQVICQNYGAQTICNGSLGSGLQLFPAPSAPPVDPGAAMATGENVGFALGRAIRAMIDANHQHQQAAAPVWQCQRRGNQLICHQ